MRGLTDCHKCYKIWEQEILSWKTVLKKTQQDDSFDQCLQMAKIANLKENRGLKNKFKAIRLRFPRGFRYIGGSLLPLYLFFSSACFYEGILNRRIVILVAKREPDLIMHPAVTASLKMLCLSGKSCLKTVSLVFAASALDRFCKWMIFGRPEYSWNEWKRTINYELWVNNQGRRKKPECVKW